MGKTHRIDDVSDLLGGAGSPENLGDLQELLLGNPGDLGDDLRRVAGEVPL
jgi:hypothetical protein